MWLPEGEIEDWPELELRVIYWDDAHHLEHLEVLNIRWGEWASETLAARNRYAEAHRLSTGQMRFDWKDTLSLVSLPRVKDDEE